MTNIILLAMAFHTPKAKVCVIDQCDKTVCMVETSIGLVEVKRIPGYKEGQTITCPLKDQEANKHD